MTIDDLALALQKEFQAIYAAMAGMREIMVTKDEFKELRKEVGEIREDIRMLDRRLVALEERVSFLEKDMRELRQEMREGFAGIREEIQEMWQALRVVDRRDQVDNLNLHIDTIEKKLGLR